MSLPLAPKPPLRRFHQARWDEPLIRDYLRISIGSDAEMDEFLQRTAEILREAGR